MASRAATSTALSLLLNLILFTMVSSNNVPSPCPPPPPPNLPKSDHGHGYEHEHGICPLDTLQLGACANILNPLVRVVIGKPPKTPCCTLIKGLADLEAAVCLCTAIKAHVLDIKLNIPVSITFLLNYCDKKVPTGFVCP